DRPMDTTFWMILLLMLCCRYLFHAATKCKVVDDDQQTIAKTRLRLGRLVPVVSIPPVPSTELQAATQKAADIANRLDGRRYNSSYTNCHRPKSRGISYRKEIAHAQPSRTDPRVTRRLTAPHPRADQGQPGPSV